ncbi:hypothetical protein BB558_005181 [Smittium angustum]|uniref:DNA replication checkpoint mediator MRC1 domain-containing protein n=1 Tax=Smittium angustum TaxID=133377 RepID=A0A2U1J185_SMIAN|nr:hypothetical protein BB558_005181 [Smittium angustum]
MESSGSEVLASTNDIINNNISMSFQKNLDIELDVPDTNLDNQLNQNNEISISEIPKPDYNMNTTSNKLFGGKLLLEARSEVLSVFEQDTPQTNIHGGNDKSGFMFDGLLSEDESDTESIGSHKETSVTLKTLKVNETKSKLWSKTEFDEDLSSKTDQNIINEYFKDNANIVKNSYQIRKSVPQLNDIAEEDNENSKTFKLQTDANPLDSKLAEMTLSSFVQVQEMLGKKKLKKPKKDSSSLSDLDKIQSMLDENGISPMPNNVIVEIKKKKMGKNTLETMQKEAERLIRSSEVFIQPKTEKKTFSWLSEKLKNKKNKKVSESTNNSTFSGIYDIKDTKDSQKTNLIPSQSKKDFISKFQFNDNGNLFEIEIEDEGSPITTNDFSEVSNEKNFEDDSSHWKSQKKTKDVSSLSDSKINPKKKLEALLSNASKSLFSIQEEDKIPQNLTTSGPKTLKQLNNTLWDVVMTQGLPTEFESEKKSNSSTDEYSDLTKYDSEYEFIQTRKKNKIKTEEEPEFTNFNNSGSEDSENERDGDMSNESEPENDEAEDESVVIKRVHKKSQAKILQIDSDDELDNDTGVNHTQSQIFESQELSSIMPNQNKNKLNFESNNSENQHMDDFSQQLTGNEYIANTQDSILKTPEESYFNKSLTALSIEKEQEYSNTQSDKVEYGVGDVNNTGNSAYSTQQTQATIPTQILSRNEFMPTLEENNQNFRLDNDENQDINTGKIRRRIVRRSEIMALKAKNKQNVGKFGDMKDLIEAEAELGSEEDEDDPKNALKLAINQRFRNLAWKKNENNDEEDITKDDEADMYYEEMDSSDEEALLAADPMVNNDSESDGDNEMVRQEHLKHSIDKDTKLVGNIIRDLTSGRMLRNRNQGNNYLLDDDEDYNDRQTRTERMLARRGLRKKLEAQEIKDANLSKIAKNPATAAFAEAALFRRVDSAKADLEEVMADWSIPLIASSSQAVEYSSKQPIFESDDHNIDSNRETNSGDEVENGLERDVIADSLKNSGYESIYHEFDGGKNTGLNNSKEDNLNFGIGIDTFGTKPTNFIPGLNEEAFTNKVRNMIVKRKTISSTYETTNNNTKRHAFGL